MGSKYIYANVDYLELLGVNAGLLLSYLQNLRHFKARSHNMISREDEIGVLVDIKKIEKIFSFIELDDLKKAMRFLVENNLLTIEKDEDSEGLYFFLHLELFKSALSFKLKDQSHDEDKKD